MRRRARSPSSRATRPPPPALRRSANAGTTRGAPVADLLAWLYSEAELAEWVEPLGRLAREAEEVYAMFNNNRDDFAPRGAVLLRGLLDEAGIEARGGRPPAPRRAPRPPASPPPPPAAVGAPPPAQDEGRPCRPSEGRFLREALEARTPLLGVCLGAQLIARAAGAWVGPAPESEIGWGGGGLSSAGRPGPGP